MPIIYDKSTSGTIMKDLRALLRLRQIEVAKELNMNSSHLSMVENGKYHFTIEHYCALVNYYEKLGVSTNVEALATGVDRKLTLPDNRQGPDTSALINTLTRTVDRLETELEQARKVIAGYRAKYG